MTLIQDNEVENGYCRNEALSNRFDLRQNSGIKERDDSSSAAVKKLSLSRWSRGHSGWQRKSWELMPSHAFADLLVAIGGSRQVLGTDFRNEWLS